MIDGPVARDVGGAVGAGVFGDNHFGVVGLSLQELIDLLEAARQTSFLVQRGEDDRQMGVILDAQKPSPANYSLKQRFDFGVRQLALRLDDAPLLQHARDADQPGDHAAQPRAGRLATPGTKRFPR